MLRNRLVEFIWLSKGLRLNPLVDIISAVFLCKYNILLNLQERGKKTYTYTRSRLTRSICEYLNRNFSSYAIPSSILCFVYRQCWTWRKGLFIAIICLHSLFFTRRTRFTLVFQFFFHSLMFFLCLCVYVEEEKEKKRADVFYRRYCYSI